MRKKKKINNSSLIETANRGWGLNTPKEIGESYWNLSHRKKSKKEQKRYE